jgi:hypothetical protein
VLALTAQAGFEIRPAYFSAQMPRVGGGLIFYSQPISILRGSALVAIQTSNCKRTSARAMPIEPVPSHLAAITFNRGNITATGVDT